MTIEQANQYFAALPDGFASTEQLRAAFTAPVQKVQFVGVAGTAGKTVTARLLAAILREAKKEQMLNSIKYGPLYSQNYYRIVKEKNRTYYEVYSLPRTETPPEDYTQVSFVCLRPDGAYEAPATVSSVCRYSRKKIGDMDDFHFHLLRHTYTTNLLSHGAAPKDVQELLGHSDVSTTMNIYAHATREAKRTSARLLDKVVGTA